MSSKFSQKQIEQYRLAFNTFDTDGSGKISTNELQSVLKAVGVDLPTESVKTIIMVFDENGDGELDFAEFLELMATAVPSNPNVEEEQIKRWKTAFDLIDTDKSGRISSTELGTLMNNLGVPLTERQLKLLIAQFDTSGTGELDFNDFCSLMKTAN